MFEKFLTKSNPTKVSEVLFNVMHITKDCMVDYYKCKDASSIFNEYHNFRTFTRFLFIRGNYNEHRQLKLYVDTEMKNFKDMLLENERWRYNDISK